MKAQIIAAIQGIGFFCVIPCFYVVTFTALQKIQYNNVSVVTLFDLAALFTLIAFCLWFWTKDIWVVASVILVAVMVAYVISL